jgi:hypothetical protein
MLKKSQKGMSFIGVMLLAPLVAVFALVVIKLTPVYIDNASVNSVLKGMAGERAESYTTSGQVRDSLMKRLDINDVRSVKTENVTVDQVGSFYDVKVNYEVRTHLFYNISIVTTFSNKGEVPVL